MNKKKLATLDMARTIKTQSLLLLERLNELDLDDRADECERLHELAEALHERLKDELERLQQDVAETHP